MLQILNDDERRELKELVLIILSLKICHSKQAKINILTHRWIAYKTRKKTLGRGVKKFSLHLWRLNWM
jgi:hypothetical protein